MVAPRALRCCASVAVLTVALLILVYSVAHAAESSDFAADVDSAVRDASVHVDTFVARDSLAQAEYASTWDQFGTNSLVDGAAPASDISTAIAEDVAAGVAAEQHFDQTEVSYLEATHSSPEQVAAAENATGSDVPPGESLDPNPSAEANPDVNFTAAEDIAPEIVASAATESGTPSSEGGDAGAAGDSPAQSGFDAVVQETQTGADQSTENTAAPDASLTADATSGSAPGDATTGSDAAGAPASDSSAGGSSDSGSDSGSSGDAAGSDASGAGDSGGGDSPASAAFALQRASKTLHSIFDTFFGMFKPHL